MFFVFSRLISNTSCCLNKNYDLYKYTQNIIKNIWKTYNLLLWFINCIVYTYIGLYILINVLCTHRSVEIFRFPFNLHLESNLKAKKYNSGSKETLSLHKSCLFFVFIIIFQLYTYRYSVENMCGFLKV